MKKYFLYELKKNSLVIVFFTVFSTFIYLTSVIPSNYEPYYVGANYDYYYRPLSHAYVPIVILMGLCTLVPILMFSFKMNAKQVDLIYSMPIKRERIYIVRSLVGLVAVFIPYTIAFWLGFIATALKVNAFVLWLYIPLYFLSIPLAVLLFGINAFVFTRANRTIDGIIFVNLYACVAALVFLSVNNIVYNFSNDNFSSLVSFFTYSPLAVLAGRFTDLISSSYSGDYGIEWITYTFGAICGLAAWVGLFFTIKYEKPENSEHISDSKFGYISLIPIYVVTIISFAGRLASIVFWVMTVIAAIIGYIIFRRSVKIKTQDWIVLACAVIIGIIISIVCNIGSAAIYGSVVI